jgi:hypothetical protein
MDAAGADSIDHMLHARRDDVIVFVVALTLVFGAPNEPSKLDCPALMNAVQRYGIETVQQYAPMMGYTIEELRWALRHCMTKSRRHDG